MWIGMESFFWFVPVIIGAAIGMYSGGVIANKGQYNPVKWDWLR